MRCSLSGFCYVLCGRHFRNFLVVLTVISDPHLYSPHVLPARQPLLYWHVSFLHYSSQDDFWSYKGKKGNFPSRLHHSDALHYTSGGTELMLLIVMACDCYIAICKPLYYETITSPRTCVSLLAVAWTTGIMHSMIQIVFVANLQFCGHSEVDSVYCDLPWFIKLACTVTYRLDLMVTAPCL